MYIWHLHKQPDCQLCKMRFVNIHFNNKHPLRDGPSAEASVSEGRVSDSVACLKTSANNSYIHSNMGRIINMPKATWPLSIWSSLSDGKFVKIY